MRNLVLALRPFGLRIVVFLAMVGVLPTSAQAQAPAPIKIEVHPVQTMTLTDEQFLTGAKNGQPRVIAGELRMPGPGTDRLPVVVLLHGAGGISGNIDRWVQHLNAMGIATFVLDSYTGRGIAGLGENQTQLGRTPVIYDAYRALEMLSKHPRVDASRIAVMGFSRGGQAALYAALKRFQRLHGADGVGFAAYVIFYPPCNLRFTDDDQVSDKPIRIFHGSDDDFVFIGPCKAYVERLQAAGKDVQITEYPGALHVFDGEYLKARVLVPRGQTTRNCAMEEGADGRIMNSATRKPFSYDDACVERGASVGFQAEAYGKSLQAVKVFLTETFKLQ